MMTNLQRIYDAIEFVDKVAIKDFFSGFVTSEKRGKFYSVFMMFVGNFSAVTSTSVYISDAKRRFNMLKCQHRNESFSALLIKVVIFLLCKLRCCCSRCSAT